MRTFNRCAKVAAIAAILLSGTALAFQAKTAPATSPVVSEKAVPNGAANPLVATPKDGLVARKPMPKNALVRKPARTLDMLIVKFGDPVVDGSSARNGELSLTNNFKNFEAEIRELQNRFGVTFRHAVQQEDAVLSELYGRAERRSGRMQPNLKSYMYVEGPAQNLQAVANALNGMAITEVVEWFEDMRPNGGADDPVGACCMPDLSCEVITEAACTLAGGTYGEDDTDCEPDPCDTGACCFRTAIGEAFQCDDTVSEDACNNFFGGYYQGTGSVCPQGMDEVICDDLTPECGEPTSGNCFWTDDENGTPFCSNGACCDLVCDQDPYCCEENTPGAHWDEYCATIANQLCATPPANRCDTPFNGNCTETNTVGGCDNSECCETVCLLDPSCCNDSWDSLCVELARENCTVADDTADFTPLQGYRTRASYLAQLMEIPENLQPLLPLTDGGLLFTGFGGEGWHLFDDDNPHEGLYGLGQELIDVYNHDEHGDGVLTRGKSIKIAIIEWGYWGPEPYTDSNNNGVYNSGEPFSDVNGDGVYTVQHEDLDVILEPGQSLFLNPTIAENDHGTATLGIVAALENEFGVTGLAPDAQAYFFPLTSVEEGPRPFAAWTSALNMLGPGDVISASYGPGPPIGNLNNSAGMWPLFRLASDLGIIVCIAAGNDCYNLDDAPDLGDSGAMVVGACSPGAPWYRLVFSNFCTAPPADNSRGNIVHVKAWGTRVATIGYGGLALPDGDRYRSYTLSFGGTSAAAPEIAGIVACLQGLAKQFYGIPLTPEQIRGALGAPGIPPPSPAPRLFGGFDDQGGNCSLDLDPAEGPNMIGPYPDVAGTFSSAATTILNQAFAGYDDSPLISDIVILTGNKIFGNKFSVKGLDNNYLVLQSEHASQSGPDMPPSLPPGVPAGVVSRATYFASGQVTDVMAVGRAPVANVSQMAIGVAYQPPPGFISMAVVEIFDWYQGRWTFVGMNFSFDNGGADVFLTYNISTPQRAVRGSDRMILYRLWQSSFGYSSPAGPGGGRPVPYIGRIDFLGLNITEGFAAPFPPPPIF